MAKSKWVMVILAAVVLAIMACLLTGCSGDTSPSPPPSGESWSAAEAEERWEAMEAEAERKLKAAEAAGDRVAGEE